MWTGYISFRRIVLSKRTLSHILRSETVSPEGSISVLVPGKESIIARPPAHEVTIDRPMWKVGLMTSHLDE
jgi:hypothetical protein